LDLTGIVYNVTTMTRRFIDLSIYFENDVITDPPFIRPTITYKTHGETMVKAGHFFPGVPAAQMPGGEGFAAAEMVTLSTHNGTHLDAPWHFHPTMDGGARAITIDEVPLDWCFRPAVKLDFPHFADGYVVTATEVAAELDRIDHLLQPLDIVLVNTAAGKAVGNPSFVNIGCGMGYEATMYLTSRGYSGDRHGCLVMGCTLQLHRAAAARVHGGVLSPWGLRLRKWISIRYS